MTQVPAILYSQTRVGVTFFGPFIFGQKTKGNTSFQAGRKSIKSVILNCTKQQVNTTGNKNSFTEDLHISSIASQGASGRCESGT